MKLNLAWISQKKFVLAPLLLMVLLLAIAACGSDSDTAATGDTMEAERMESEAAMEAEKMEQDKMESEAAMEAEKMDADKMDGDAMAMDSEKKDGDAMAMMDGPSLKLDLSGVEPLANGYHYEGWAIIDGAPVSTGKFNVGADGVLAALDGKVKESGVFHSVPGLEAATDIVVTIEPAGDVDDIPSATHYLAGSIDSGSASLSVGHPAALGGDFGAAAGVYILATPTNGGGNDENRGIWFLDLSSGSPEVGLELPVLPEGWAYEGWVVIDGIPVTSGRFLEADEVDQDNPFSGPEGGPPFPGEDYLRDAPAGLVFPTDLAGGTAVISVEPSPDDAASPFTLKPLIGAISEDATDHVTYSLEAGVVALPSGSASIGEF